MKKTILTTMKNGVWAAAVAAPLFLAGCDAFGPMSKAQDFFMSIKTIKQVSMLIDFSSATDPLSPSNAAKIVVNHLTGTWGNTNDLSKITYLAGKGNNDFSIGIQIKGYKKILFTCNTQVKEKEAAVTCNQQ
jgi:hypothetical protein